MHVQEPPKSLENWGQTPISQYQYDDIMQCFELVSDPVSFASAGVGGGLQRCVGTCCQRR
jgi:hypothetical protein